MLSTLVLLLTLARAEPPPDDAGPAEAPAEPKPAEAPPAEPAPAEPAYRFVVSAEALKQGDDRTATRLEGVVRDAEPALSACHAQTTQAGAPPEAYLQLQVWMRPSDGGVRKLSVLKSTGAPAVDACLQQTVLGLTIDPPPKFPDQIELNLTWAPPLPPVP